MLGCHFNTFAIWVIACLVLAYINLFTGYVRSGVTLFYSRLVPLFGCVREESRVVAFFTQQILC